MPPVAIAGVVVLGRSDNVLNTQLTNHTKLPPIVQSENQSTFRVNARDRRIKARQD